MPFVPVLVITAVYILLYQTKFFKRKIKRLNPPIFFYLHMLAGILATYLAFRHFFRKLPALAHISDLMIITGAIMLVLFVVQIIVGVCIKCRPNAKLFKIHRFIVPVIIVLALAHAIIF